jgi:uncharacterized protein YutE (UPF0331/DUF86 family)
MSVKRDDNSQLCLVIHDWARNIDKNKQTDIFILDFEKALDTVPHDQLKTKLYRYGITRWLMIFEQTICSASLHWIHVSETGR